MNEDGRDVFVALDPELLDEENYYSVTSVNIKNSGWISIDILSFHSLKGFILRGAMVSKMRQDFSSAADLNTLEKHYLKFYGGLH